MYVCIFGTVIDVSNRQPVDEMHQQPGHGQPEDNDQSVIHIPEITIPGVSCAFCKRSSMIRCTGCKDENGFKVVLCAECWTKHLTQIKGMHRVKETTRQQVRNVEEEKK